MEPRPVTPLKPGKGPDGGKQEQTINDAPYDPAADGPPTSPLAELRADLDVMLDAQAVQLDTTTTTKQRSDAAKAIRALIAKRLRPDGT